MLDKWLLFYKQEAERFKNQLDYFLNQRKELLKNEGKNKTMMEMDISKIKVEDSKHTLLEKETRKSLVTDSGRQKTNAKIQEHSQVRINQNRENSISEKNSNMCYKKFVFYIVAYSICIYYLQKFYALFFIFFIAWTCCILHWLSQVTILNTNLYIYTYIMYISKYIRYILVLNDHLNT